MIRGSRLPFILLAFSSLLLGLWTGLHRLGWNLSSLSANLHHGAIMVGGFLGTLITLEKIIPLKRKALFIIPALSGTAVVLFVMDRPDHAFLLLVVASFSLSVTFVYYLVREKNLVYVLMTAGGVCWLTGNLLVMNSNFYPLAFPWWAGFALLIITAERLELTKFLPVSIRARIVLCLLLLAYLSGAIMSFHGPGNLVCGVSLVAISLWLMRNDIMGVSIKKKELPRYVAIALMAGYIAMLFTGVFLIALDQHALAYDVTIHTFFLGFVFSMIFAHGPIILPGVLGVSLKPFHPLLYCWLFILHLSWLVRAGSDIFLDFETRKISGIISALAILGYFATLAITTFSKLRRNAKIV